MTKVAVVVLALVASGCSNGNAADAAAAGSQAGSPQAGTATGNEACSLLTTAQVQRAFPGSAAGQVNRSQEKRGLRICVWTYPTGRLQLYLGAGTESPTDEARTWMLAFLDPLRGDAERHVRFEPLTGVGDQAVAVVERQDASKGFAQDGAILVVRKGSRQVSALSTDLAKRERTQALAVFADLGKAIAARLR